MGMKTWLATLGILALWLLTGYVNIRSDEPQPSALVIVLSCFALTAVRPRLALFWVVLFAGSIPASYLLAAVLHIPVIDPPNGLHRWISTAVALVPAAVAACAGLLARILYCAQNSRP